jgi:hypothetical protein
MIHGDCSSRGCYAMTDEQIGEIYSLARESFLGGQKQFQVQAYPFRMTPTNMARHRNNPNMAFWKMIKVGDDHFLVSHMEPKVDVCEKHYVFDAQAPDGSAKPLTFSPSGRCPAYVVNPDIATAAEEKQRNDDYQFTQLVASNTATVPLNNGTFDGGMNKVFASKLDTATYTYDDQGHIHVPPLQPGRLPPQMSNGPSPEATASTASSKGNNNSSSSSGSFLGSLFGSKSSTAPTQTASATPSHSGFFGSLFSSHDSADATASPPPDTQQTSAPTKPKTAARNPAPATASVRLKPSIDASKADPQTADAAKTTAAPAATPAPAPQKEASNGGTIKGAQPVVPSGSFDTRWGGFQ